MNLDVSNIQYQLGKKTLLNDISLSMNKGERVALIGPNGCGKSTLLRLICGLNKPSTGQIRLNGKAIDRYPRRALAQHLSFVQQKATTEELVKAEDAVALGRTPWIKAFERWSETHQTYVDQALEKVSMLHKRQQHWHTLSGGEQQRLHIARALAQNTPFIVMDEPTNHLDIKQQMVVLSLIETIQRTMLVAVHDLNHALRFDRIIAMKDGQIIAQGRPEVLINEAFIADVFEVQSRVIHSSDHPPHIQLLN
ncbi:ABC transporter ATP-binding protein [Marinomonas gallaica]|uniref:ABC transporter ATP-binding protein n=1 Tax=Marinomonas gallaica TaxID=1806667 RepID=UPI00082A974B|nr:ABC transporter ATP-binding protein [Marinomonas gallaica]